MAEDFSLVEGEFVGCSSGGCTPELAIRSSFSFAAGEAETVAEVERRESDLEALRIMVAGRPELVRMERRGNEALVDLLRSRGASGWPDEIPYAGSRGAMTH